MRNQSIFELNKEDNALQKKRDAKLRNRKRSMIGILLATFCFFIFCTLHALNFKAGVYGMFICGCALVGSFLMFNSLNDRLMTISKRRREIKQEKRLIKASK